MFVQTSIHPLAKAHPSMKPSLLDRAIGIISPMAGVRRLAAKRLLHEFKYDGATFTNRRSNGPAQIAPNSFQVQRDRLQLLREATDRNRGAAYAGAVNELRRTHSTAISHSSR